MHTKIEAVNELLLEGEPGNISTDEHSGYTGYRPQAVVDAMNEVLWGEWGFSEVGSEIVPGDKGALAVAQVQVWLAGLEFKPTSWGQNRVTRGDIGDARKGAQTDAIKKALSYFSIGNRAYQGLLKEDKGKNGSTVSRQPSPPTTRPNAPQSPNGHVPQSSTATEAKGQPAPVQSQLSVLGKAIIAAKECGFITGATPDERAASWQEQLNQIFDGNVPPEADLKQPANLARVNGAIEAHRRHVAERKATSGK